MGSFERVLLCCRFPAQVLRNPSPNGSRAAIVTFTLGSIRTAPRGALQYCVLAIKQTNRSSQFAKTPEFLRMSQSG